MSELSLNRFARVHFPPPSYLALPTAGIEISTSSIKAVLLAERTHGIEATSFDEIMLPDGAVVRSEVVDPKVISDIVRKLAKERGIKAAHVALPESKAYLFEARVSGKNQEEWYMAVEQHIDEYVPLPPGEVAFDIAPLHTSGQETLVVGVGYARRVIESTLRILDEVHIEPRSMESETFAGMRALLPPGTSETVMVVDIGRSTTKIIIAERRLPRFATTLDVGGHALTLAVQKYFGVQEKEAHRVKMEHGIVSSGGNDEYLAAMLLSASVIRDEVKRRLDYWQARATNEKDCQPISHVLLVGGNATVRGLPEYFSSSFNVPVMLGDVLTNLASRDVWLPSVDYAQSFAYATTIGLALRDFYGI
ncbi:MAG TPA: pilus assembly protein PilM [Candidatus Paceibacterota bacterium]